MTREEQIEEMVDIMWRHRNDPPQDSKTAMFTHFANALQDAGYSKVNENFYTKEEIEMYKKRKQEKAEE